jgi:hypothetical protein
LITRTIVPIASQPGFTPLQDRVNGIGDIQFTAFLSPAKSKGLIWGAGKVAAQGLDLRVEEREYFRGLMNLPRRDERMRWGIGGWDSGTPVFGKHT